MKLKAKLAITATGLFCCLFLRNSLAGNQFDGIYVGTLTFAPGFSQNPNCHEWSFKSGEFGQFTSVLTENHKITVTNGKLTWGFGGDWHMDVVQDGSFEGSVPIPGNISQTRKLENGRIVGNQLSGVFRSTGCKFDIKYQRQ